jgi:hypothetical protein
LLTLAVNVPAPSTVPPETFIAVPVLVIAPPFSRVAPAVCV